jgi:hypothetical protein
MKLIALPLAALFALGCTDPLSTEDVAGRYELQRVRNDPLPVAWAGPADAPQRLLAGHLVLSPDRSAEWVMRVEELLGQGAPRIVEHRSNWVFDLDGNRLTLRTPPCTAQDCAASAAQMELRIVGDDLIGVGGFYYARSDAAAP